VRCFEFLFPITLGEAEIRALPPADVRTVPVRFVVKTFTLVKENDFAEIRVPGLSGEPRQFVRGHSRTLSMILSFDGRATNREFLTLQELLREVQLQQDAETPGRSLNDDIQASCPDFI
jgi:hypothetical protein